LAHIEQWGWTPGLVPADDAPLLPMEQMRDMLLDAFTQAPPTGPQLGGIPPANGG